MGSGRRPLPETDTSANALHLASGVGLIAAFQVVLRGLWVGNVVALGVVVVLQVVRGWGEFACNGSSARDTALA